jgi:uncharacterized protein (UPF0548 family)
LSVLLVQPRRAEAVESVLRRAQSDEPTFTVRDGVIPEETPIGFRRIAKSIQLGRGSAAFDRAKEGVRTWRGHKILGLRIFPTATPPTTSGTIVVTLGSGVLSIAAPCRIVTVIDEPSRFGFVYATLPGHPERGAESFIVTISDEDAVTFQIAALSTPGEMFTRMAGPLGRFVQSAATTGYLRSMRRHVQGLAGFT